MRTVKVFEEAWPLHTPFVIARGSRSEARVVSNRVPDYDEAAALYLGSQIVNMLIGDETCEFAMSRSSMTGLMSWLESAPPGHRYHPTSSDERSEL